jgi:hypothetical protein
MASPEALLLRHRVHTTNIYKKAIGSARRRLFKIGHLCAYFLIYFYHSRRLNASPPKESEFQNGILHAVRSSDGAMATSVTSRLRASLRVRILTPGHSKGGRVARYFLLSLAFNSSCENGATGVQWR